MTIHITTTAERRNAIRRLAAGQALALPVLPSGYWFHGDVRNNFYFAIHLFASCVEGDGQAGATQEQRDAAMKLAVDMIGNVLKLQVQDAAHPMYGHWPLGLGDNPSAAKPHPLPVELMGCLIVLFYNKFKQVLPIGLKSELNLSILHMYQSDVYRHPLQHIHHHEAKHTALKLLLGHQFDDGELLEQGMRYLRQQLRHIQQYGFKEYGCLPWHWHWIQAFACVWEIVDKPEVRSTVGEMLDFLWRLRADFYLRGAWVGAQSRQWPHDAPLDNNTLLDYIAFGDFPEPNAITRLEGAALYSYEVADDIVDKAVNRPLPQEIKRQIRFADADGVVTEEAHTYVYIAPEYAAGGVWERRDEFDNEQQRWDVTLPLTSPAVAGGGSVNQAFFFHPGAKYKPGDDRHASPYGDVLFHLDSIVQLWAVPAGGASDSAYPELVGCMPKGEWRFRERSGCGLAGDVYFVFYLMQPFTYTEKADRISIASSLKDGMNGVVMEVVSRTEADGLGIASLDQLAERMDSMSATFVRTGTPGSDGGLLQASYRTRRGDALSLTVSEAAGAAGLNRSVNGQPVPLTDYPTGELFS
ncbi:hypothetical protein [Paenibacillus piri]|uniref:DUF2264 domain-containing protein n=1 Tax=Paenibacillus piri TaxID=2547395 RepID=A0A4R5KFM2_9BACL|nr:hypothetical protein [Paenibacillus piri]TDF94181.1 hypothetical protein E1757_25165 [Paenibacillus piri]